VLSGGVVLLAVAERTRRRERRLTQDLLKYIAKDLDGVPSWSSLAELL
jgi:hypothetical protein